MDRTRRIWGLAWFAGTLAVGGGYGYAVDTLPDHPLAMFAFVAGCLCIGIAGWTAYDHWRNRPAEIESDILDRHRPKPEGFTSKIWDRTYLDELSVQECGIPSRFHRCWIQTREIHKYDGTVGDQCACGAARIDDGPWTNKNLRYRQRRKQVAELL